MPPRFTDAVWASPVEVLLLWTIETLARNLIEFLEVTLTFRMCGEGRLRFNSTKHTFHRVLEAMGGNGIGARNNDEIRVDPGICGGTNFLNHVCRCDNALSREMSAPLGKLLILELDGIGPAAFENADGACNVERVAETGVCIDDQRQSDNIAHRADVVGEFRH